MNQTRISYDTPRLQFPVNIVVVVHHWSCRLVQCLDLKLILIDHHQVLSLGLSPTSFSSTNLWYQCRVLVWSDHCQPNHPTNPCWTDRHWYRYVICTTLSTFIFNNVIAGAGIESMTFGFIADSLCLLCTFKASILCPFWCVLHLPLQSSANMYWPNRSQCTSGFSTI